MGTDLPMGAVGFDSAGMPIIPGDRVKVLRYVAVPIVGTVHAESCGWDKCPHDFCVTVVPSTGGLTRYFDADELEVQAKGE